MILPKVFRNAFFVKESITEDQISVAFSYFLSLSYDLKKYRINPKSFNTEVLESYQGYRIISILKAVQQLTYLILESVVIGYFL